jgi:3-oxoacyl-ACP reductase-like protein
MKEQVYVENVIIRCFIICTVHLISLAYQIQWERKDIQNIWKMRNAYKVLITKAEEMTSFGTARYRWVDNIEMDLTEIGCVDLDWFI